MRPNPNPNPNSNPKFSFSPSLSLVLLLTLLLSHVSFTFAHRQEALSSLCPDYDRASSQDRPRTRRVAIIGAGPSGTSAAYFIKTANDHMRQLHPHMAANQTPLINVTVFERDTRIGGRTAVVHPYDDATYEPVELGASIFADVNFNMRRAVKQFGLQTGAQNGMGKQIGIWDGQQFVLEVDSNSWWTSAKVLLRYGLSPARVEGIVKDQVAKFSRLYSPLFLHKPAKSKSQTQTGTETASGYPWRTVEQLAQAVEATDLADRTAYDYFYHEKGLSSLFVQEMIEAATRVNYAQDTTQIHAFGGLISLAATGATGVLGGNYQVFEQFLKHSGARIKTGEHGQVTGLVKFDSVAASIASGKLSCRQAADRGWLGAAAAAAADGADEARWWVGTKSGGGGVFDAVIIATPWHNADITLLNTHKRIPTPRYVQLHVTLLTTNTTSPNPTYFGRGTGDKVPETIMTTDESVRQAQHAKAKNKKKAAKNKTAKTPHLEFLSLNYLRPLRKAANESADESADGDAGEKGESVVKIFSYAEMSDAKLAELFGAGGVGWVHRHVWDAYPYLEPTSRFAHLEVDEKLYFANSLERLVSTMETSTVGAKNAVARLLSRWYGDDFVNGGQECPWEKEEEEEEQGEDAVLNNANWAGWGCTSG